MSWFIKNINNHIFSFFIISLVIFLCLSGFFEGIEQKLIDWRFNKNHINGSCATVAIVDITGGDPRAGFNQPVRRSLIAMALDKIIEADARAVALDVLLSDKTFEYEDAVLAAVLKRHSKRIALAARMFEAAATEEKPSLVTVKKKSIITAHPDFISTTDSIGLINIDSVSQNPDGVIRNINLATKIDGFDAPIDSLALKGIKYYFSGGGRAVRTAGFLPSINSYFINYYAPYNDSPFAKISLSTILGSDTDEVRKMVADRLVFVAAISPPAGELRMSPLGMMPGVEIHASVAANILQSQYATRVSFHFNILLIVLLAIMTALYLEKVRAIYDFIVAPCAVLLYVSFAWALFVKYRFFLDVMPCVTLVVFQPLIVRFYQNVRKIYVTNVELQKMLERIGGLYDIARLSQKLTGLQELLNITVVEISKILKCGRISIVVEDPKSKSLILKAAIGFSGGVRPIENLILERKSPIISRVIETAEPLLVENIDEEKNISSDTKMSYLAKSFVCVPLIISGGRAVGALSLTDKQCQEKFSMEDIKAITVFASQIANNIEHIFNISSEVERKRLDRELDIASGMQKRLVPAGIKKLSNFEIYGSYIPAREVSGDYYDCIALDSDHLLILVGDVSGKGVPAGLFMMTVRTFLHTIIKFEKSLSKIIEALNDYLTANSESTAFLTIFMGVLNVQNGDLEYVNGGHLPPYIIKKNNAIEELETKNLVCGIFKGVLYDLGKARLEKDDFLFIFTDGVTEAHNAKDELYGDERLREFLLSLNRSSCASEQVEAVLKSVKDFAGGIDQFDDITILAIKAL